MDPDVDQLDLVVPAAGLELREVFGEGAGNGLGPSRQDDRLHPVGVGRPADVGALPVERRPEAFVGEVMS